jgi:hypothetical protein|tara:strand:- start:3016 stop:3480 length:465 start_codon:yes stop_codon:yes gene_type:complete
MDKRSLRTEIVKAGKWTRFCAVRNAYEAEGMKPDESYAKAAGEILGRDVNKKDEVELDGAVDSTVFASGNASTPECVSWVAKNIMLKDAKPSDAPSSEAWSMLCWARRNNQNEAQFWGTIYTKLLPSRSQLDAEQKYRDDGRAVLAVIERLKSG